MTDLKVETGLQQLVHSLRRQAAVGQKEGGESLIGSQVFFHWQIWGRSTNTDHYQQKTRENLILIFKSMFPKAHNPSDLNHCCMIRDRKYWLKD